MKMLVFALSGRALILPGATAAQTAARTGDHASLLCHDGPEIRFSDVDTQPEAFQ
ncbi:hypothetical protein [Brevundimonas sp. A19_0]|uniref:hypothetical protein n=1 Tax=Brevundimonas sp. A19_0 TaxID=2821087 RepID=UPI001ADC2E62|nr:hypothetical protein [Brevundimonas sp. A19_0]MBO9502479.1 hypothetical protein [Brevundimonas sp. A19_0]